VFTQGTLSEGEGSGTADLQVLTSLDKLIFRLKIVFTFFYKTSYLNEEVNCTEPSPSVSIPWFTASLAAVKLSSKIIARLNFKTITIKPTFTDYRWQKGWCVYVQTVTFLF